MGINQADDRPDKMQTSTNAPKTMTDSKEYGFLDEPIGIKHIYCNRSKGGLWYHIVEGNEINIPKKSFRSVKGGLKGLTLHEAERGGKSLWKLGLILEGDNNQIYRFETGLGSVFSRGMLWAIASMTPEQIEGEIGLNPTPADPAKLDSKFAKSILYCNMFCDGVEISSYPGGMDVDWQRLAHQALSLANRTDYPIANIPPSHVFQTEEAQNKPATGKSWQPNQPNKSPSNPSAPQSDRSGVSYPNQPLKSQKPAPRTVDEAQLKVAQEREFEAKKEQLLSRCYDELFARIEATFPAYNLEIDRERLNKVVSSGGVTRFEQLTNYRKHQIICTFAIELICSLCIAHPAAAVLNEISVITPIDESAFETLQTALEQAFDEMHIYITQKEPD